MTFSKTGGLVPGLADLGCIGIKATGTVGYLKLLQTLHFALPSISSASFMAWVSNKTPWAALSSTLSGATLMVPGHPLGVILDITKRRFEVSVTHNVLHWIFAQHRLWVNSLIQMKTS